jgi:ApaG protein
MVTKISSGVQISVDVFYQKEYSNPILNEYMFAYKINIENKNNFPIQLLRRHWHIVESNGSNREVDGDGVIGVQPTIQPGDTYQYVSGCNLQTDIGKMFGTYTMKNLYKKNEFTVIIPAFEMIYPFKCN